MYCFPGGSEVKASAWNAGDPSSIPELGRSPGEGNGKPTLVLLPGESHGGKSLVGYSPWGCKESDTTERLHFFTSLPLIQPEHLRNKKDLGAELIQSPFDI